MIDEPDTPLAQALRARIRAEGPLRFDRFMDAALYDPQHGYYAKGPDIGAGGDFSTSVRFPPFRLAVARLAHAAWARLDKPGTFRLVELGAGTGQLAQTVAAWWREHVPAQLDYVTVETSAALRARQAAVPGVRSLARADVLDPGIPTLVFGNEVLDALPVRRVTGGPDGGLLEVHVDVNPAGRFVERLLPADDPALEARFARVGARPQRGQLCDVAMGIDALVRDAARLVDPGYLVLVDYGDVAPRLYRPTRLNGTLAAYRAHGKFHDPFARVGEQDLTADVDFTATTRAAEDAGLEALGITTQSEWLAALGVEDLGTPDDVRMVAGLANLGTAFSVLAFRRNARETLPGFEPE